MPARRSPRSIRRLDGTKSAVLLVLSVLAIILFVTLSYQQQKQLLPPIAEVTPVPTFTAEAVVAAPVLISPLTGETVTAGTVQVSGTAQPGVTVKVSLDGQPLGTAITGENGAWSLLARVPEAGPHTLAVEALDAGGQVMSAAEAISVTVASVAVRAPAIDSNLLSSSLTAGIVTLTGSGEPGSTVQILVGGQPIGETRVDTQGHWAFPADIRAPGVYAFALNAIDAGGKVLATATPVRLIIDAQAQAVAAVPPTSTATPSNTPAPTETFTAEPTATPIPTETPTSGPTDTVTATLEPTATATATSAPAAVERIVVAGAGDDRHVAVAGTGLPGTEVQVVVDETTVATTTIDESGAWSIDASLPLTRAASIGVQIAGALGIETQTEALTVPLDRVILELPTATPVPASTPTPVPTATGTDTPRRCCQQRPPLRRQHLFLATQQRQCRQRQRQALLQARRLLR